MTTKPNTKKQLWILGICFASWAITLWVANKYFPGKIDHLWLLSVIVVIFFVAWAMGVLAELLTWFLSTEEDEW